MIPIQDQQVSALLQEWPFQFLVRRQGQLQALSFIQEFRLVEAAPNEILDSRSRSLVYVLLRGKTVLLGPAGQQSSGAYLQFREAQQTCLKQNQLGPLRVGNEFELVGCPISQNRIFGALALERVVALSISLQNFYDRLAVQIYQRDLAYHLKEIRSRYNLLS